MPRKTKLWDDQTLEKQRLRREKHSDGHITFNCPFSHVQGLRVYCKQGRLLHPYSNDGSIRLKAIIRGITPSICRNCKFLTEQ